MHEMKAASFCIKPLSNPAVRLDSDCWSALYTSQFDSNENGGDGSECDSEDDEGGDTEQLMSTFRLEVESDIDEEEGLEDDSIWILHDNDKDTFFNTRINEMLLLEMLMKVYFTCKVTLTSTLA